MAASNKDGAIAKTSTLERVSNVAVILVAVVVLFSVVRHEFFQPSPNNNSSLKGTSVQMGDITTAPAKVNLVLGISTVCHFCEQNVPFYQQLAALESPGKMAFFTVFPQSTTEATAFLNQKEIHPSGVVSSPLSTYKITGTPTLMLVDASGKVKEAWVGALDATRQADVVKTIQKYE